MADDWQVGDLALCVDDSRRPVTSRDTGLRCGRVYTVTDVMVVPVVPPRTGLALGGVDMSAFRFGLAGAMRFVKVTPPEADEFDRETIDLMNGAPVGEPVA